MADIFSDIAFYIKNHDKRLEKLETQGSGGVASGLWAGRPGSPANNQRYFATDFRSDFLYTTTDSAWHQMGVPHFQNSFPASPAQSLRVYRDDLDIEFEYGTYGISRWFSVQKYPWSFTARTAQPTGYAATQTPFFSGPTELHDVVVNGLSIMPESISFSIYNNAAQSGVNYWNWNLSLYGTTGGVTPTGGTGNFNGTAAGYNYPRAALYSASNIYTSTNGLHAEFYATANSGSAPTMYLFPSVKFRIVI